VFERFDPLDPFEARDGVPFDARDGVPLDARDGVPLNARDGVPGPPRSRGELDPALPAPSVPGRLARAHEELEALHRAELSALLCEAAALRVRSAGGILPASYPTPRRSRAELLRRLRDARELARADGLHGTGPVVARLARSGAEDGVERWPSARALVDEARRLSDGLRSRLCAGHCLVALGSGEEAVALFRSLFVGAGASDWRAFEGLAHAHESAGRTRLALGAMDAAADDPECGLEPLLSGLYLSLRAGDRRRAERAAARIDLLADPLAPEFASALERLCRRRLRACGEGPMAGKGTERLLAELACGGLSPAERVGRALA